MIPVNYSEEQLHEAFKDSFMKPEIIKQGCVIITYSYGESYCMPDDCYNPEDFAEHTIERHDNKYLARLSARGYLDSTEWAMLDDLQEAINFLITAYGNE